jgi:hypothetical protein
MNDQPLFIRMRAAWPGHRPHASRRRDTPALREPTRSTRNDFRHEAGTNIDSMLGDANA